MKNYPWMTSDQSVTFDRFVTSDLRVSPAAASASAAPSYQGSTEAMSARQRGTGLFTCVSILGRTFTDRAHSGLLAWSTTG